MDTDLIDRLLPVATLLLGAGIARMGKRGDARRAAAEQLAELRRVVWKKGGDGDWIELNVFMGRLTVALRTTGVPQRLVSGLQHAAIAHWKSVELVPDPEIVSAVSRSASLRLEQAQGRVLDWLDRPWHVVRRWRAFRAAGRSN